MCTMIWNRFYIESRIKNKKYWEIKYHFNYDTQHFYSAISMLSNTRWQLLFNTTISSYCVGRKVEITTFSLHSTLFYKNWPQENISYKKYNYRGHIISSHCSLFFFIKRLITQFLLLTMEIGLKARVEKVFSSQTVS